MTTHVEFQHHARPTAERGSAWRLIVPLGRVLFAGIFIVASLGHFSSGAIAYAASQGVPVPSVAVPLSGVLALAGGASIALGFHARVGAWLLVLFLLPVTFMMHRFWMIHDPMTHQVQQAMFLKNLSMLGGAFLITYFGAGPGSLDSASEDPDRKRTPPIDEPRTS